MLKALRELGTVVMNNSHWDVQMLKLIKFIDGFEWSKSEPKLCNWHDEVSVGDLRYCLSLGIY